VEALQRQSQEAAAQRDQQAAEEAAQLRQREESHTSALQLAKQQLLAEIETRAQQQQAEAAAVQELREAAETASAKRLAELESQLQAATDSVGQLGQRLKQASVDAHNECAELQASADKQRGIIAEQLEAAVQAREKVSGEVQQLSDRVQQLS